MWLKRDDFKTIKCCFLPVTAIKVTVKDLPIQSTRNRAGFIFFA